MKIKQIFLMSQIEEAVETMYYAKLVQKWRGFLCLETDCKKIYLSQYPSSNSWTAGTWRLAYIDEHVTWSDIIEDLKYDSETDEWIDDENNRKTAQQVWNDISIFDCIDIDQIYERMSDIKTEDQNKMKA
jgi:hypothetical protein